MLRLIDELCKLYGFTPVHGATVAEAIAAANEHVVDAVILDLRLGAQSGLDVLAWLREQPRYRLTPVFILTGAVDISDNERTFMQQHWAFVYQKGRSVQVLMEYVRRVLSGLNQPPDVGRDAATRAAREIQPI